MTGEILKMTVGGLFTVVTGRSSAQELVFVCPEPGCHDTSGNRSVNLLNGKTSCWRCGKGGDFVRWANRLGYGLVEQRPVGASLDGLDLSVAPRLPSALPPVLEVALPVGFTPCSEQPNSVYSQLIGEMAERKNLTLQDLMAAGVGYTKLSNLWEPYAIFPVREYRRAVYYQGRTYVDVPGESTKRFPNRQEVKWGAKFWVYGIDEVRAARPETVIVVESILNVLSLRKLIAQMGVEGVVPVAVFKHSVSAPQAKKLLDRTGVRELCLLYDHDASQRSWEKAPLLSDRTRVSIAEMPLGRGGAKTDPNDDVELAWEAYLSRKPFTAADALTAMTGDMAMGRAPIVGAAPDGGAVNPLDSIGELLASPRMAVA